jgi:hypothetical protein
LAINVQQYSWSECFWIELFTHSYSVSRGMSMGTKKKAETSKFLLKMLQPYCQSDSQPFGGITLPVGARVVLAALLGAKH